MARNEDECIDCPAGKYCPLEGESNDASAEDCEAGYYCDGGDASATPSLKRCTSQDYCEIGSKFRKPCPPGYECGSDGKSKANCSAKYECKLVRMQTDMTKTEWTRAGCPVGHFCDGNGIEACHRGTYQSEFENILKFRFKTKLRKKKSTIFF